MNLIISISLTIFLILLYNQIYFYIYKEKIVFFKYFKNFIIFTIILFSIIFFSNLKFIKLIDSNFLQSLITTYFLIFFVIFFNISTKSYESPTVIIYNLIKKNGSIYNKILNNLKKKKLVEIRIKDLIKQKLIIKKNKSIKLSPLGYKFSKFYLFLKSFYKIKSKG